LIFFNIIQGTFVVFRRILSGLARIFCLFGRIDVPLYEGDPALVV
jgi:hypothetical protein